MSVIGLATALTLLIGCDGAGGGVEAVDSVPLSLGTESAAENASAIDGAATSSPTTSSDLSVVGESRVILEFGLFGPMPMTDAETYESDCRFEDDPYETCL